MQDWSELYHLVSSSQLWGRAKAAYSWGCELAGMGTREPSRREKKEGKRECSLKAVLQLWATALSSRQCANCIIKPWELLRDSNIGGTVLWMQISDTLNITKGTAVPSYKSLLLFSLEHCVQLWSLSCEKNRAREENIQRRAVRLVSMKIFGLCISVRKETRRHIKKYII